MTLILDTYSVDIPKEEEIFFKKFVQKMGWTITKRANPPCVMTTKQLKQEVLQAVIEAEKGKGISIKEARLRH